MAATADSPLADQQAAMKKEGFNCFIAYQYLISADKAKYGSLIKTLKQQMSFGQNQFPKDIDSDHKVLISHTWDNARALKSNRDRQRQASEKDKDKDKEVEGNFHQRKRQDRCFACGDENHKLPQCTKKDEIPKSKWWINMKPNEQQANAQDATQAASQGNANSQPNSTRNIDQEQWQLASAWNNLRGTQGAQCHQVYQPAEHTVLSAQESNNQGSTTFGMLEGKVCMDSGSTISTFHDKTLLSNIKDVE